MYKIIFFILVSLAIVSIHAEEIPADQKIGSEIVLSIKKDAISKKKFLIKIPPNFVAINSVAVEKEKFYEFIPEGESPYMWSEIITIMQIPSKSNSMIQLLKRLEAECKVKNEKCLHYLAEENGVKVAFLTTDTLACFPNSNPGATTVKIPGKNELLVMKIIQELDGFAIVQISVKYDNKSSPETKEKIREKMFDFVKSCEICDNAV